MTFSPDEPQGGERSLDPADETAFREAAHKLLDACLDHILGARTRPWRPVADGERARLSPEMPVQGIGEAAIARDLAETVLPHATGNTHPRFFGWVHGTGLPAGLLAEMTAAAMNSNCGGRDHGAVDVERAVIDWTRQVFGFPQGASGVLVTGTSQATVIALAAARVRALGAEVRKTGLRDTPELVLYCAEGTHSAVRKAIELLGHGSGALRMVPTPSTSAGMEVETLRTMIVEDRAAGRHPFAVVGTAGSVDTGACDDLDALADLCQAEGLWFHVDGAFGAWARIAGAPWADLVRGIERADSLAFDFHKWMYVQYDCGAVLIRDEAAHRAAFAMRPTYLASQEDGLGGGEPWYCDYGTDLSRGFRALKVWTALRTHGLERFGEQIAQNCRQAARLGVLVGEADELELSAPVVLNICCFRARAEGLVPEAVDCLNARIAARLQIEGEAVLSTTRIGGRVCLRAAIVNHRTRDDDLVATVSAVRRALAEEVSGTGRADDPEATADSAFEVVEAAASRSDRVTRLVAVGSRKG